MNDGLPTSNTIWRETTAGRYILFTRDTKLVRTLRGWNAHRDGRIADMAEVFGSGSHPIAWQLRFVPALLNRVTQAAGLFKN